MYKRPTEETIPSRPIMTKNKEECLYPVGLFGSLDPCSIKAPLMRGKNDNERLYIVCISPKAVPVIFFSTTKGMAGIIQFP